MKRITRVVTLLTLLSSVTLCGWASTAIAVVEAISPPIMCNGENTGSIGINANGGTGPYTYHWSNGATTQNLNSLAAGTYTVTVTDNTGATASFSFTVNQPAPISIIKNVTNEQCGGQDIGAVNLTVSGGTGSLSFAWNNGATTQSISNLTAEVYYVTVTDANGCSVVDSANVTQPPGIGIEDTITDVTCSAGLNDGAIAVGVQFGNAPYHYLWSNGATTLGLNNITTGNYSITVTDALSCTATASADVSQQPGSISINTTPVDPTCYGGSNGSVTVNSVVGSTGPYTFLWSNNATSQNVAGLSAGNYVVTVTSGTGCSASASVTLTQPAQISVTLHTFPSTCFDSNNGAITTTVNTGAWPYSYSWSNGSNASDITNLPSGTYNLTVTDNDGCTVAAIAALVTQPLVVAATATPSQLACTGGATGSVMTTVTGGTSPYSYWWGAGISSADRIDVNAGSYTVTVTDAHGCTATTTGTVAPYTPMTFYTTQTNIVCYTSSNGTLEIMVSNGLEPYTYLWSNGDTEDSLNSLAGGSYDVTVTDAHNCTITASRTINSPPFPITVNSTAVDVSCYGLHTGSLDLNPINGAPPYNYKWGNGATSALITNLAAGNYVVTITDSFGCKVPDVFTVTQPPLITPVAVVSNDSCFGDNTGSINLSVTGGYSPFTYAWNDGVDSQNRVRLYAGGYTVTITDNHGCTALSGATVGQPPPLAVNISTSAPLCFGASNGSATVNVSGGTPGYTYSWGNGNLTTGINAIPAGAYPVTVTDNMGCTGHATATLIAPAAISITANATSVACNGGNNGGITLNITGGTLPYSFNWGGGIISQNRANLVAGSYTVTVTDTAGCTAVNTSTITESTSLTLTSVINNVTCFGMTNGSIKVTPTGGTAPYNYSWGVGSTFIEQTNLATGTYPLTVTDHAGCEVIISPVVSQPAILSVTATVTPVTCFGMANGAIQVTASGGTLPYSYSWAGGITTQNRANLAAGRYALTVTDSAGCIVGVADSVYQPAPLVIVPVQTNVLCNGGNTGSITPIVTGGTIPYSFIWGGEISSQNRANLSTGAYTVTVTDSNGCSVTHTFVITQPNVLTIDTIITNIACFGQPSGAIALTVGGGTNPFTYSWNTGSATKDIGGLVPGNYAVTVTDSNACSASVSATITQPSQITTSVFSVTDANCFGAADAVVTIQIAGGTPLYSYSWTNGATTQNLTGVGAGTYTVTAADAHGCTASTIINVTQPNPITLTSVVTNAVCYNGSTGTITVTGHGGNGGFSYNWSNGETGASDTGLLAGNYIVTVTDAGNCSALFTAQVNQPTQITLTTTESGVNCSGGSTGAASVAATGGTGVYTYQWSNGQTSSQITQLAQGTFRVTVSDANLCSASDSVNIAQSNSMVLNLTAVNVACFGQSTGSINSAVTGGAGGYLYSWSNTSTTANATGLAAGNYDLTVTDVNQCSVSASASVAQNSAVTVTPIVTNAVCFDSSTGAIQITATGGAGNYTYTWSNGETGANVTGLSAGNYRVTVNDANGCSVSRSAAISQPTQINVSLTKTDVSCNGGNNGAITSVASGGIGAFTYGWSNASTTAGINNLRAGNYSLTVKDASGCTANSSINISQPSIITIHAVTTAVMCNGGNDGAINLQVNGGTGAYTFSWSNEATTQQIGQLIAGNYGVTVQDANSCTASASSNISQPAAMVVTTTQSDYACANKAGTIDVTVTGGTSPYTYTWQDGNAQQNRSGLSAGNYTVTVTDQNHCTQTTGATVGQITALTAAITATNVSCFGGNTGTMAVAVTGGSQPYTYNWSNAGNTAGIQNLTANSYSVVVTDANSCTVSSAASVSQPAAIQLASTSTSVTCNGLSDGTASVSASGGTPSYTYKWNNGGTGGEISNLGAGVYAVTVTDGNNCTAVFNDVSVTQPALLSISSNVTPLGCTSQNDGSVKVAAGGGTPPYQYNWSNNEKTTDLDSLSAGTYTVTINDNNSCAISESFVVATVRPMSVTSTVQNTSCTGVDNGSVSVIVTGGASPYNYDWSNGQHTEIANGLADGAYAVTITDANGCSIESGGNVAGGYDLTIHASASSTVTAGTPVQLSVTASTDHQNIYSWTPVNVLTCSTCASTQASPQQTTLFTVSAVDMNGCKASDTITIEVITQTEIFIPNAFTPNGDGVNDQFKIFGDLSNVYFIDMAVFDRWGEKVFESGNPNFEWDGTYKGEPAPQGVYIYTATLAFGDGSHRDYKGSLTLLR